MDKRRNKRYHNNQNPSSREQKNVFQKKAFQFNKNTYENIEAEKARQKSIEELKNRKTICPKCGQPITDIMSALNDKATNSPVHFDCAIAEISKNEKLSANEKVAYIGQGRFGILNFENPHDQKNFTIKKIIDVENHEENPKWRSEISSLYSQIQ